MGRGETIDELSNGEAVMGVEDWGDLGGAREDKVAASLTAVVGEMCRIFEIGKVTLAGGIDDIVVSWACEARKGKISSLNTTRGETEIRLDLGS